MQVRLHGSRGGVFGGHRPPGTPVAPCIKFNLELERERTKEEKEREEVLHLFGCYTHTRTHTATHSNAHEFCSACFRNGVAKSQSWSALPLKNVEKRCLFCCSYCLPEHVYNVSIMRNFPKCLAWRQTAFMRFMTGSTGIAPPAEWCNSSHEILETMWKHDMKCYEYQSQYPWMDFNAWLSMALASSVTKNIL